MAEEEEAKRSMIWPDDADNTLDFEHFMVGKAKKPIARIPKDDLVNMLTIEGGLLETVAGGSTSATPTILAPGPSGQKRKMENVRGWFVNGSGSPLVATGTPWNAPDDFDNTNFWTGSTWKLGASNPLPKQDLTNIEDSIDTINADLRTFKKNYIYSLTVASNANSTALSAINNVEITVNGTLSKVKGRFPATGEMVMFVARNRQMVTSTQYKFDVAKVFSVVVPATGEQTIDVSSLNISVQIGDRLGVSTASTSKPYYGVDATLGFGWYQTSSIPAEGNTVSFNEGTTANWAIGFEVSEFKFAEKVNVYDKVTTNNLLSLKLARNEVFSESKPYNLPFTNTSSNADVFLLNDKPALADGRIKTITLNANAAGRVQCQLMTRSTFNASTPNAKDTFIAGKSFSFDVLAGLRTYALPDVVEIKKGQYTAITGGTGNILTPYNSTTSLSGHLGWFQSGPGVKVEGLVSQLTYQPYTAIFEYTIESDIYQKAVSNSYKLNKIVATRNAEDFNSIRNIIANIIDATDMNQYEIFVPNGEWHECDLQGKKNVFIRGESKYGTIIKFDPVFDSDKLAPIDYAFASYAGVAFKDIPKIYRHLIFVKDDLNIKNLTCWAITSKYVAHIDYTGFSKVNCTNVLFKEDDCSYAIGVGINGGQELYFDRCTIEAVTNAGKLGVFLHNWNNQNRASKITFNRCKFDNCGYAMIDELGSAQVDEWNFLNCFTTDKTNAGDFTFMVDKYSSGTTFYIINPATGEREPDPAKVPYCIKLNTTGTKIRRLNFSDASNFNSAYTWKQRDEAKIKKYNDIDL